MKRLISGTILLSIFFLFLLPIGLTARSAFAQTSEEQAVAQARFLLQQAAVFRMEHQGQPVASLAALAEAGYLDPTLLSDPWGQPFEYAATSGPEGELAVWSRGPTGTGGFTLGDLGRFTGEAIGYSTRTGLYLQGR